MRPTSLLPGLAGLGGCTQVLHRPGQCCHCAGALRWLNSRRGDSRLEVRCGPHSFGRRAEPYSVMAVPLQGLAGCWGSLPASPGRAAQAHRLRHWDCLCPKLAQTWHGLLGEALLPINVADTVISSPGHVHKPLQLSSSAAPELIAWAAPRDASSGVFVCLLVKHTLDKLPTDN